MLSLPEVLPQPAEMLREQERELGSAPSPSTPADQPDLQAGGGSSGLLSSIFIK